MGEAAEFEERLNAGWYNDPPDYLFDEYGVEYADKKGKKHVRWYEDEHIARGALTQLRRYHTDCKLVRYRR